MTDQLYPFQAEGVQFMLENEGTLLADEMGLGKTLQAIGLVNALPVQEHILICMFGNHALGL